MSHFKISKILLNFVFYQNAKMNKISANFKNLDRNYLSQIRPKVFGGSANALAYYADVYNAQKCFITSY
jgi:hypothetical protein